MSSSGPRLFRSALLFEITANSIGFLPAIFAPETVLSFLLKSPAMMTPATKSLMQWFGVLIATGFTLPLILCYPQPGSANVDIVAWRRLTYLMFGAGEMGLGAMMLVHWMQGDSGLSENALLFTPLNPRPMLQALVNDEVRIRLKWNQTEYTGRLVSVDSYMNIQLSGTEEWIGGKNTGVLGQVLIRCNNVLWISAKNQDKANGNGDIKMEG
ncbi:hypothetical protein LTR62_003951 [Meristemomyces frigidus]|uniref:Sm protein F n=1 Tax=Meristemomyces frigidus TaxID=1508187 RepID=A0AAN7TN93_9PEZI|nr:hypothetical protein LTR62_003951 [Meristemomyces frigidus]